MIKFFAVFPCLFGRAGLSGVLVLALLLPATVSSADERQAKAQELHRLQAQIQQLRAALEAGRKQQKDLRTELHTSEREISTLSESITRLERRSQEQAGELHKLMQREKDLQTGLVSERGALAAQVRAAFIAGRQEQLKLLLTQQDPAVAGRTLVYYEYLNRARAERIAAVMQRLQELTQVRHTIAHRREELDGLRAQQQQERRALEELRVVRAALLEQVSSDVRDKGHALKRLLEDEQRLQQVLRELERPRVDALAKAETHRTNGARGSFADLKGKLPWPAPGPLGANFGATRNLGDLRWRGVFITAPEGQEVRAIAHGQVVFADWLRGFGQLLIIDHGGGYMSLYGYNKNLQKGTGAWVESGEVIATVGNSGGQDQYGLYFEVRHNGEPVNPGIWCRSMPEQQGRG